MNNMTQANKKGWDGYDVQNDRVELYPCTFSLKAMVI